MKVLVLNADYTCHDIWSWKKTFTKMFQSNRIDIVEKSDYNVRDSKGNVYNIPSVVVIRKYISDNNKPAPLSRMNIYTRDNLECQYCGARLPINKLTLDHVIPKSTWRKENRKGRCNSYENLVTCCSPCNRKKGDRTPKQADMPLLTFPKNVTKAQAFRNKIRNMNSYRKEWETYL